MSGNLSGGHYIPCEKQGKIRILFLLQAATVWASWESVYYACVKDPDIEVRLLLLSETVIEKSHLVMAEEFLKEQQIPYEKFEDFDLQAYKPHPCLQKLLLKIYRCIYNFVEEDLKFLLRKEKVLLRERLNTKTRLFNMLEWRNWYTH